MWEWHSRRYDKFIAEAKRGRDRYSMATRLWRFMDDRVSRLELRQKQARAREVAANRLAAP